MKINIIFGLLAIGLVVFSILFIPWYRVEQNNWALHDINNDKKQAEQDWEFCHEIFNNTNDILLCLQKSDSAKNGFGYGQQLNYQDVFNKTLYVNDIVVQDYGFGFYYGNKMFSPFLLNLLYIILFIDDIITILTFAYWSFTWRD